MRLGEEVLFTGPVNGAAYDAEQELVWFRTGGTLEVIDLRARRCRSRPSCRRRARARSRSRGRRRPGSSRAWTSGCSYPSLATGKTTKLTPVQNGDFGTNGDDDATAHRKIKKAKLVGAKWLKTLAKRTARAVPAHQVNATAKKIAPPDPDQCEEADACGFATTLGDSKYLVVVTGTATGPGCS